MTIQTRPAERKEMAHAIAGFLGTRAEYMRAPTYGFRIGCVTVNRDGTTDCEDPEVLERLIPMLIENNYLTEAPTPEDTPATKPERIQEPDPATAPAQETPAQTAEPDSHEDPEPLVAPEAPDPISRSLFPRNMLSLLPLSSAPVLFSSVASVLFQGEEQSVRAKIHVQVAV